MIAKKKKKKRGNQNLLSSILIGIFLLGVVSLLVFFNIKINQRRAELLTQIESLEKEIQLLEEKNSQLRAGISQTGKESYWEEQAREQGLIREGENQVVIIPPEQEQLKKEEESSFWNFQNWLEWIRSKMRD